MSEEKYTCVKELHLPKYDDHEMLLEEETYVVDKGTEWSMQEHASMSDVRLENKTGWIEIAFEDFKNHFTKL